jgi:hypothetical protein
VLSNVALMREEADAMGAALWIGEDGGMTNTAGIVPYMDAGYDAAAAALAGSMYWHYGRDPSYGVLDANGDEEPELLAVLVRPYPERVAGDLFAWSYDETTRVLQLSVRPAGGTTVIAMPARVYPDGVNVECGGCDVIVEDGRAQLSGDVGPALRVSPR